MGGRLRSLLVASFAVAFMECKPLPRVTDLVRSESVRGISCRAANRFLRNHALSDFPEPPPEKRAWIRRSTPGSFTSADFRCTYRPLGTALGWRVSCARHGRTVLFRIVPPWLPPIIRSFSVELLNPRVARLHWTLDSRAVLKLHVEGQRHGTTRGQPVGVLPVPPFGEHANRPAKKGAGAARVNFEFGEFNFEGVPKIRFTLIARNSTGRDESRSITRDPTP
jgi:hypothetical protein